MDAIVTLLVTGVSGVLIAAGVFFSKKLEGYAMDYSQKSPKLKHPFFQKFLIPMITPISLFVLVIIFVLMMSLSY